MKSLTTTPPQSQEFKDVIPALLRALPLKAKVACLLVHGYTVADYGTEAMATELLEEFGRECLAATQAGKADPETQRMIGSWLEQETWLAHA